MRPFSVGIAGSKGNSGPLGRIGRCFRVDKDLQGSQMGPTAWPKKLRFLEDFNGKHRTNEWAPREGNKKVFRSGIAQPLIFFIGA